MFPNHSNTFSTSLSHSFNSGDFSAGASAGGKTQANSRGEKRGIFKNVVPVDIKTILQHREDDGPLMIHGIEVGLVSLVAQIRDVFTDDQDDSNTLTFKLDDDTGNIEGVQYLQDEVPPVVPLRNTWVKIIGKFYKLIFKV